MSGYCDSCRRYDEETREINGKSYCASCYTFNVLVCGVCSTTKWRTEYPEGSTTCMECTKLQQEQAEKSATEERKQQKAKSKKVRKKQKELARQAKQQQAIDRQAQAERDLEAQQRATETAARNQQAREIKRLNEIERVKTKYADNPLLLKLKLRKLEKDPARPTV